eukprot:3934160-Rhodomonas_salina.1
MKCWLKSECLPAFQMAEMQEILANSNRGFRYGEDANGEVDEIVTDLVGIMGTWKIEDNRRSAAPVFGEDHLDIVDGNRLSVMQSDAQEIVKAWINIEDDAEVAAEEALMVIEPDDEEVAEKEAEEIADVLIVLEEGPPPSVSQVEVQVAVLQQHLLALEECVAELSVAEVDGVSAFADTHRAAQRLTQVFTRQRHEYLTANRRTQQGISGFMTAPRPQLPPTTRKRRRHCEHWFRERLWELEDGGRAVWSLVENTCAEAVCKGQLLPCKGPPPALPSGKRAGSALSVCTQRAAQNGQPFVRNRPFSPPALLPEPPVHTDRSTVQMHPCSTLRLARKITLMILEQHTRVRCKSPRTISQRA